MKDRVVIIGAGLMQKPLIERCLKLGYIASVVDVNSSAVGFIEGTDKIVSDISDTDGTLQNVVSFFQSLPAPVGCLTAGTDFSLTVALIARHYGLWGVSVESAVKATDKVLMRECFLKKGVSQPRFTSLQEGGLYEGGLLFPLVVKPCDNMGARGVCIVSTTDELEKAISVAFSFSKKKKIIIEEFIEGSEFSLDAVILDDVVHITGVGDRSIEHFPYRVEIGHNLPSVFGQEVVDAVSSEFKKAIRALDIVNGFAKGDVFYDFNKKKAFIGEVAARLSGGFMSAYTYPLSSGVDLHTNALLAATRRFKEMDLQEKKRRFVIERAIISKKEGILKAIHHLDELKKVDGVREVFILRKEGDFVASPKNNVEKIGNVIVEAKTFEKAFEQMRQALSLIEIELV